MRAFRSTLILLVVFLGLAGYIYFVESKREPSSSITEKKDKVFPGLDGGKISELSVQQTTLQPTTLKQVDGAWQITAPITTKADQAEATAIASNLASLEIQRVVDDNPTDLGQFALQQPRTTITFKKADDKEPTTLQLGDKTTTGSDLYAKLPNDKRVFLVPAYLETTFNRSAFDLRDKTALKFDRDKVDSLDVTTADGTLQVSKAGADWKLAKPVVARADYGTVEGLIGRLTTLQMKTISVDDINSLKPDEAKKYGFDKPEATVTLGAGSARTVLLVGSKAEDGSVYARDASNPMVFTVDSVFADEVKKGASDYRRKDAFEFRSFNATRIEAVLADKTIAFEKTKGTGADAKDVWKQVLPAPAKDVDLNAIENALTKISNLRAQSFADAKATTASMGLDKPVATITVKFDDGKKEEKVVFGKAGADAFASRPDEPGAAKLDAKEFDEAIKAISEVK